MLVMVLAGCSRSNAAPPSTSRPSTSTTTTAPGPVVKIEKLAGGTGSPYVYDYTVEYPQLDGLVDGDMQRTINGELAKAASNLVGDFVARVTEEPPPSTTSTPSTSSTSTSSSTTSTWNPATATTSGLKATSEATLIDRRVASFRLSSYSYIAGAAHGSTTLLTFSYDLATGRRLMLADLFRPGIDYLGWLSRESVGQLAARPAVYDPVQTPSGLTPTEDHFAHFVLTPVGLDVTFTEYQVGPYAIGTPHVTFPYAQLRPLLATPGPLDGR
jgi:hypothetical protein